MLISGFIRHNNFKKRFSRLDSDTKDAFMRRMHIFLNAPTSPLLNNHSLHGEWKGYWSINITGDIRLIYKVQGHIAILIDIGSHSELYGK